MKRLVIGMLAHVDAGKTTLSEAVLYKSGAIRHFGRVDNRDAFLDTNTLERERGITIFAKQAVFSLSDTEITLMDTPGHVDFSTEMERTLGVLDYAVLVISATDGVQSHTETLWRLLTRSHVPTFLFVNKMDRPEANASRVLEELKRKLHGSITDFTHFDAEEVALCDELLLNTYLETGEVSVADCARVISERKLFPCFFGSALRLSGINAFLEGLAHYTQMPSYPAEFGARVFKITRDGSGNRLTHMKITGGTLSARMVMPGGEKVNQIRIYSGDKFTTVGSAEAGTICAASGLEKTAAGQSLGSDSGAGLPVLEPVLRYRLLLPEGTDPLLLLPKLRLLEEEDPTLQISWNELYREIHVRVMGTVQMEILSRRIEERFGVSASFGTGSIVYKETISSPVEGIGHFEPLRHYAEVHLLMEPGEPGSGIVIATACSEDRLSKNWQRLILTHLYEKSHVGVLTGSPLTDVRITLIAGRAHEKHTEGGDFRQATYRAVRHGLMQAQSVLLEPIYAFRLSVPAESIGRAMTDLERKCAHFTLEQQEMMAVLTGTIPVAALGDYATEVLGYTKGTGTLQCQLQGYAPCHNAEEVIRSFNYDAEHDTLNPASSVFCAHGAGFVVPWQEVCNYMHLPSMSAEQGEDGTIYLSERRREPSRVSDAESLGTEEVDAILKQTYYANSRTTEPFRKTKPRTDTPVKPYVGKETFQNAELSYLLVDGYNIIFAWKELSELAKVNLDGARGRLMDILCNYQAYRKCELIVVFDAYRVAGHVTEVSDYHNIHVVYTKEAETADQYIEKFADTHGRKYYVRVATSDGLEQIIIRGKGCHLVSAREFEAEVRELESAIAEQYLNRTL